VQLQDISYEVYIKGGDEDDIRLVLDVVDRLRNNYGINIYLRVGDEDWLYGGLENDLKIFICGRVIDLNKGEALNSRDKVEYLISEILGSINVSKGFTKESLSVINEGPGRFSSAEYLLAEIN